MGEEGFSSDSSLLYHRNIPSAIADARAWELPDLSTTPNHPLKPRHLRLHDLFPDEAPIRGVDAVTGAGSCWATATCASRTPSPTRRAPCYRNGIGDECVYVERGSGTGRDRVRRVRRRAPATTSSSRAPRRTGGCPRRRGQRAAARLLHRGQQPHRAAEALPVALRPAARARAVLRARPARCPRGRCWPRTRRGGRRATEVFIKHRGNGPRRLVGTRPHLPFHPLDVVGWDGCLYPYAFNVARLRADHRPGAPAAAGAPGLRGLQLRGLQLRAAQGRLPPAVDPGALLPLQRRQRRGHVLRRRRLRGAQGLRHRQGLDLGPPRAATPTARSRARTRPRSGWSTSTSSRSWSTPSGRSSSARPGGRPTTAATRGPGPAAGRGRTARAAAPDWKTGAPTFPPYVIKRVRTPDGKDVMVGILGLVTPGVAIWDRDNVEGKVRFPRHRRAGQDVRAAPQARRRRRRHRLLPLRVQDVLLVRRRAALPRERQHPSGTNRSPTSTPSWSGTRTRRSPSSSSSTRRPAARSCCPSR